MRVGGQGIARARPGTGREWHTGKISVAGNDIAGDLGRIGGVVIKNAVTGVVGHGVCVDSKRGTIGINAMVVTCDRVVLDQGGNIRSCMNAIAVTGNGTVSDCRAADCIMIYTMIGIVGNRPPIDQRG